MDFPTSLRGLGSMLFDEVMQTENGIQSLELQLNSLCANARLVEIENGPLRMLRLLEKLLTDCFRLNYEDVSVIKTFLCSLRPISSAFQNVYIGLENHEASRFLRYFFRVCKEAGTPIWKFWPYDYYRTSALNGFTGMLRVIMRRQRLHDIWLLLDLGFTFWDLMENAIVKSRYEQYDQELIDYPLFRTVTRMVQDMLQDFEYLEEEHVRFLLVCFFSSTDSWVPTSNELTAKFQLRNEGGEKSDWEVCPEKMCRLTRLYEKVLPEFAMTQLVPPVIV